MSKIEWTDATWNPVRGCSRVSAGCTHCYAERMASRNLPEMRSPTTGKPFAERGSNGPHWTGAVELIPSKLDEPLRWRKPRRVFVNSMSDLFHESLSLEDIGRVFEVIYACLGKDHTFQILTKRARRMLDVIDALHDAIGPRVWPLPNVWLGVSVEDRAALSRIDMLRETPAAVRFVSFEPLLESLGPLNLAGIHWAIIGGESGPGARPMEVAWARHVVRQCRATGVAVFYKQGGASNRCPHSTKGGHLDCCPPDLQIREFPNAT